MIRHEKIHFYQQLELLFIFHWLLYAVFYSISRLKGQRHYIAYRFNPFEQEAYDNDLHIDYLGKRRAYAWVKFMKSFWQTQAIDMNDKVPKKKEITW